MISPANPRSTKTPTPERNQVLASLRTLLTRKEAPFLLGALAAILCWLLSHISSRLLDARLIEYNSHRTTQKDGSEELVYTIKNLTRTAVFTDLSFALDVEGEGSLLGNPQHQYNPNSPAAPPPEILPDASAEKAGLTATFADTNDTTIICKIEQLHPQRTATLKVRVTKGTEAPLRFQIKPPNAGGEVLPVLFQEASLWTWMVANEFCLTLVLSAIVTICIVLYAVFLGRTPETSSG